MAMEFNFSFTKKGKKLSKDQQYILLMILGSGIFLGGAGAVIATSINRISFNTKVIMAEDQAIDNYSNAIRDYGVCPRPSGKIYTDKELKDCNPDTVDLARVQDTLRSNVLEKRAFNQALASVPKENSSICINSTTGKDYTPAELTQNYNTAKTDEDRVSATNLIRSCSALRVIPDALPSVKNEEALLSSVDNIYRMSGYEPDNISPSGKVDVANIGTNLNVIQVNLPTIDADISTTMTILKNVERSIRNFNVTGASIEWGRENTLTVKAQADAFYVDVSKLVEVDKRITEESK